ncbi:hypothetical protein Q1695_001836 [Nippostrongylus brasiliensis]|nr:hypothetical protein Q1695_001836 [Nippostrongylus brasiliensis]
MLKFIRRIASSSPLKYHLMFTNTTLCVTQLGLGDCLQQYLHGDMEIEGWDSSRSARLGTCGLVIGPMMTVWYRFLDKRYDSRRLSIVIKKTAVDACTNPVFSSTLITTCGLLEGKTFRDAFGDYLSKMFYILKAHRFVFMATYTVHFVSIITTSSSCGVY